MRRAVPIVVVVLLAACGEGGNDPVLEAPASTAPSDNSASSTMAPPDTTEAPARRIEVAVVGGKPIGGAHTERVRLGERVVLVVTADTDDEVHVHGYDLKADVGPDAPATIEFTASIPGAFEVELEGSHQLVLELEVA